MEPDSQCRHGTGGCWNIYRTSLGAWQHAFSRKLLGEHSASHVSFLALRFYFIFRQLGLAPCRSAFGAKSVVRAQLPGWLFISSSSSGLFSSVRDRAPTLSATRKNGGCDDGNLNAQVSRFSFAEMECAYVFERSRTCMVT